MGSHNLEGSKLVIVPPEVYKEVGTSSSTADEVLEDRGLKAEAEAREALEVVSGGEEVLHVADER